LSLKIFSAIEKVTSMPPTVNAQSSAFLQLTPLLPGGFGERVALPGDRSNFSPCTFHFIRFFFLIQAMGAAQFAIWNGGEILTVPLFFF
jgi:hypothetical protein